jgi:hypothetical protein
MISPSMYANVPGMGYLGLPGVQQAASFAGKAVDAVAKAPGAARIAGSVGLKAAGAATKFLGPIGLATTAVGGVLNAGNRMMKGENPVTAVTNAAYDTADFATFGLLKPAVGMIQGAGESLGKAVFGQSPEDAINESARELQEAQASGDIGRAAVAQQKLQKSMSAVTGQPSNEQDYTMQLQNQRFGNEMGQRGQMLDQQFNNNVRAKESDFQFARRAANQAMNNSYYADNWKNNQTMGRDMLLGAVQQAQLGQQGITQAMTMRY